MGRAGYDCTGAAYGSHAHKATREIYRSLAGPTPRANTPVQANSSSYVLGADASTPRASAMMMMASAGASAGMQQVSSGTYGMQNGMVGYGGGGGGVVTQGYRQPAYMAQQPQHHQYQQQGAYLQSNGVRYTSAVPQGYAYGIPQQASQAAYPVQGAVGQAGYCVGGGGVSGGVAYSYPAPQGYPGSRSSRGPYY